MSEGLEKPRAARARAIARAGGVDAALEAETLPRFADLSLSEALVLGLLRQGVRKYLGVFGHGSTDLAEALRVYEAEGLVEVFNLRSEIEASHAAVALKRSYGETAAVFTSIGPGALQALSASIVGQSDGIGLYYIFGDETTHDEGFNMQQIPRPEQNGFLKLASVMGGSYCLHTGEALPAALKRGASYVFGPENPSPFYLLLPMNEQARVMESFNVSELPKVPSFPRIAPVEPGDYREAARMIAAAKRVTVKAGNGARGVGRELMEEFLELADAAYVHGPSAVGILPGGHPRNMTVGGSKGSISGNAVMAAADLVVSIGARSVCQWDSSGTGFKNARAIISVNSRFEDAAHYNKSLPLVGDASLVLAGLVAALRDVGAEARGPESEWMAEARRLRSSWDGFLEERVAVEALEDPKFGRALLTQPAAIATALAFAARKSAIKYFDAGDVQANGFQLTEDDAVGDTVTETGASYMGFAASAVLASAIADAPRYPIAFSGDGSFTMCPQSLIDGVALGLRGMIIVFDNRRMAAISSLQRSQYGAEFRTDDDVVVDYKALADAVAGARGFFGGYSTRELEACLEEAYGFEGLSIVHVPVYGGPDERGGLGSYGDWNVGAWCRDVQREKHRLGL